MKLFWHRYKYYPYEKGLALREVKSLLDPYAIAETNDGVHLTRPGRPELASRLVYFSGYAPRNTDSTSKTQQSVLERINGNGVKRQSTRYSAHGLHEYKGKFNPQVAKALLNIFLAEPGQAAIDPFCGSGTSLVECAHLGIDAVGTDINPLAVFIANAKLQSLRVPAECLLQDATLCLATAKSLQNVKLADDERVAYLRSWFPAHYLQEIEKLRVSIERVDGVSSQVLLAIASNLLRDYSFQEPHDLRIRRRKTPFPDIRFFHAYEAAVRAFHTRLSDAQHALGGAQGKQRAIHVDCKKASDHPSLPLGTFDLALTSPPYATALPYIDTQRLSLIWLGLLAPSSISSLEAELVGSREIRGQSKKALLTALEANEARLPAAEADLCVRLQHALCDGDGFRRQVVPRLLYRYFSGMFDAFSSVRRLVKVNAPFGLIVGGNHTVLGGTRFDINTAGHLTSLATSRGWQHVETIPLQTYQRYGLHMNNATTSEALVILRAEAD